MSRSARTTRIPPIEINKGTTRIVKYCTTTFIVTDAVLDQDRGGLRERVSAINVSLSPPRVSLPGESKRKNGTGMKAACVSNFFAHLFFHLEGVINVTFASH